MSENKKSDDLSVDDIIKDVMRKKRNVKSNTSETDRDKANEKIYVKRSDVKVDDINSKDYFKSFYNDLKSDKIADEKSNMHRSISDIEALKKQEEYMRKSLNEVPDSDDTGDNAMSELFAHAVESSGKKLSPAQQAAIKEARNPKPKKTVKNEIKTQKSELLAPAKPDEWRTDGIPLSDLVAGAMQARKHDKPNSIDNEIEPISTAEVLDIETDELQGKKKRRKWSVKKKVSVILCYVLGIVLLLCGAGISVFSYYTGKLDRNGNEIIKMFIPGQSDIGSNDTVNAVDYEKMLKDKLAKSAANVVSDSDVTNILLVGEDLRDATENNAQSNGNTDVIMLVSVNTAKGTVTTTSLMRDIYLQIPGYYATRINAAYSMGGIPLLEQTIEENFSIKVDRYLKVNFYSFIDIVDTIGGLDIKISKAEALGMAHPLGEQNKYLGNKQGTDYFKKGGLKHMNGNQALAYARLRKVGNSDWERTQRQRTVIDLIANKARDLSLMELKSLLDKVIDKISTDLTDAEIAYYLLNASTYLNYERQQIQIPVEGTYTCETIRGASVLCPDFSSNIRELQQKIYGYTKIGDDETDSGYQTGNNNGYSDSAADNGYNNSYDNGTSTYNNNNYNDTGANTFY